MTSPSSYVFFHKDNHREERKEDAHLVRVFITDRRMTVYSKQIVRTAKSGVLFEKILAQQTYSLHENSHGEPYLKRFSKSASGSITDTSLEVAVTNRSASDRLISNGFSAKCMELQESTILGWFGLNYMPGSLESNKVSFLFPALRDKLFPRDAGISRVLADLQVRDSNVTKALRENSSWESFIRDICKPTVQTTEDIALIQKYPCTLIPIGSMELPSISTMYKEDGETLLNVVSAFNPRDLGILNFMLKYLPANRRSEAYRLLFDLTRIHMERRDNSLPMHRFIQSAEASLKRVPAKLRPELAEELLKRLKITYNDESPLYYVDSYLHMPLANTFRHWFAQAVLEPQLKTSVTMEDIRNRYLKLFAVELPETSSPLRFHSKEDLKFCSLHMLYSRGKIDQYHTNLFSSLIALVSKQRPQDKGAGTGYSMLNGYVNEVGDFVPLSGGLYSLDDILHIIEAGAAETDERLTKMGRKITPENRTAFLTFGNKERKFKNTWKYYDWGVTDAERIMALKKAKVAKKTDVETYNALPDDMFYELLALESGKELITASY